MSKNKKITFNMIASMMKDDEPKVVTVPGIDNCTITVNKRLGLKQAIQFIGNITSLCVDLDMGEYSPEVYDFAVRMNVLMSYAGFDMPKDFNKAYKVVYGSKIYKAVWDAIDQDQCYVLMEAADERIKYARDMMVSGATQKLAELIEKMDGAMNDSLNTLQQVGSPDFLKTLDSMQHVVSATNGERQDKQMGDIVPFSKE